MTQLRILGYDSLEQEAGRLLACSRALRELRYEPQPLSEGTEGISKFTSCMMSFTKLIDNFSALTELDARNLRSREQDWQALSGLFPHTDN